jgi:serine protease Do
MTRQSGALIGLTAVVCFLLGLVAAGTRPPASASLTRLRAPNSSPLSLASADASGGGSESTGGVGVDFAAVAARVNAAVVNVDTASRGDDRPRPSRRYSTDDPNAPREGSGSGFVIDPAGFILTNHHVVVGADRITVTLADGRSFRAEIVGMDPALDVALLQVHGHDPLPVAPLGNSDRLRVGEWVCAIGNPLGVFVHSVTVGVVSFLGRKLFDQSLDAYIQTDAAISFGNSGGPLINARGEVVGITTAISAQAMNIGFAIPISQVTAILPQLRERGTVARGYLDMGLTTLTPALRRALLVAPEHGALVQDVSSDTPAHRAGVRPYDVVTTIDGHPVLGAEELIRYAAGLAPGTVATLDVWRDGLTRQVGVKLGVRRLPNTDGRRLTSRTEVRHATAAQAPLGLKVRDLDPDITTELRIPDSVQGVLVSEVDTAGPAHLARVQTSNVIVEVNRRPVRSEAEFRAIAATIKPGEPVALLVFDHWTGTRVIRTVIADAQP